MADDVRHIHLETIKIDGQTLYVIKNKERAEALMEMADNRIFVKEAQRRMKRITWVGGVVLGGLITMAAYWPQIDSVVRALLTFFNFGQG